jgi:peptidoglycan/xylan/chitin deacetylase (PgdA/CDA1 family)
MKIKRIALRAAAALLITAAGLIFYMDVSSSSTVPVLMYHTIDPNGDDTSPYISPAIFEKQMDFLARHHYNVVAPEEVVAYASKKEKMPWRTVAITADDGFENFYTYAFPLLKKYNLKATVFMATDKIGEPGMLNWRELREMSDSGLVTIGSHTKSHPWLPTISVDEDRLREELAGSKKRLEDGLGRRVDFICYPNGGFNDLIKETARRAGYKGGFTTNPAKSSKIDDIYAIRRIKMSSTSVSPLILWGKISRYYAWFKERR